MQLISKFNEGILVNMLGLLLWKTKKVITITNAIQKILIISNHKPNKICIDKGSEFNNRSMKSWPAKKNAMKMCSVHSEGKPVVAERFIRTLKNKIYECVSSVPKNVYIDQLDDIVNKCNNTYHKTIKMKPVNRSQNNARSSDIIILNFVQSFCEQKSEII